MIMNCRDVSTLIARAELMQAPLGRRLAVRLHLAFCRQCRAFQRQLEAMSRAARAAAAGVSDEPGTAFEAELIRRMRHGPPPPS